MKKTIHLTFILFFCFFANVSHVEEQTADVQMNGSQIIASLSGNKFIGKDESFEQSFGDLSKTPDDQNGVSTTYSEGGRPSFGRWRVTNNQYCSVWPPNSGWACYDMATFQRESKVWVVWIASDNTRYEAHFK